MTQHRHTEPPEAPPVKRKLRFYFFQLIGFPLILLIPIVAMFGVFDQIPAQAHEGNAELSLRIDYPGRYRYQTQGIILIYVQNNTEETIPSLSLAMSRNYFDNFSELRFYPGLSQISAENYIIELTEIPPDSSKMIRIELLASNYGEHTGRITATAAGMEALHLSINSFTFP